GGAFVEIFSAQGKNPGAKWKILGSPSVIWKEFDKEVKSFVFVLEGSSQTNKIQLPKENKQIRNSFLFIIVDLYIHVMPSAPMPLMMFLTKSNHFYFTLEIFLPPPADCPISVVSKLSFSWVWNN
ncbi:hypothetical protein FD755_010719, partial [Muntiacus reevesi]